MFGQNGCDEVESVSGDPCGESDGASPFLALQTIVHCFVCYGRFVSKLKKAKQHCKSTDQSWHCKCIVAASNKVQTDVINITVGNPMEPPPSLLCHNIALTEQKLLSLQGAMLSSRRFK